MVDTRTARQEEGIAKWLAAKGRASWCWCTALGKTHTSLTVIKRVQQAHPGATVCVVVPTIFLQQAFQEKFREQDIVADCLVINTFVKQERHYDFIIADEVHLFLSQHAEQFSKLFTVATYKWFLGLSGSLTPEELLRLEQLGIPVVDTVTIEEARKQNWVAPYRQYNLPVELTAEERVAYDRNHKLFVQHFSKWGHSFQLAMACVGDPYARRKHADFMGWRETDGPKHVWSPTSIGAFANIWHRAMKERKHIVDHAAAKYTAALELIHKFPVPTICFSESTAFASELASRCPDMCRAYHSQLPSITEEYTVTKTFKTKPDEVLQKTKRVSGATMATAAINAFRDRGNSIRCLSTARALDQGADFPELRLGIETSGSGTVRQKVQRTGRVVRKDSTAPEDEQQAVYVHIYADNTYEKAKLKRKQQGMQVQEVSEINSITF